VYEVRELSLAGVDFYRADREGLTLRSGYIFLYEFLLLAFVFLADL
jgi:hypothetical protein